MGANCGKEEAAGFESSTAKEQSIKRIASGVGGGGKENELQPVTAALSQPAINRAHSEKSTKALKGKALLAACMLDEDSDEEGEKFVDFNDDKTNANVPGLIADSPTATEREKRAEKKRREGSPSGTFSGSGDGSLRNSGSRRKSKRFAVGKEEGDGGKGSKALKGKALLQACMAQDDDWSDDD